MRAVLFYADGSEYCGPPEGAPYRGLVCIAHEDQAVGTRVIKGNWFAFYDGLWWNHDTDTDLLDELQHDAGRFVVVRRGQYVQPDSFYFALLQRAREVVFN